LKNSPSAPGFSRSIVTCCTVTDVPALCSAMPVAPPVIATWSTLAVTERFGTEGSEPMNSATAGQETLHGGGPSSCTSLTV
jgi:hypothetical protein